MKGKKNVKSYYLAQKEGGLILNSFCGDLSSTAALAAVLKTLTACNLDEIRILEEVESPEAQRLKSFVMDFRNAKVEGLKISPRQREVLECVTLGKANKEIANDLNITVRTVKFHISTLFNKFNVTDRHQLTKLVYSEAVQ